MEISENKMIKSITKKINLLIVRTIRVLINRYLFITVLVSVFLSTKQIWDTQELGIIVYLTADKSILGNRPSRLFGLMSHIPLTITQTRIIIFLICFVVTLFISFALYLFARDIKDDRGRIFVIAGASAVLEIIMDYCRYMYWDYTSVSHYIALCLIVWAYFFLLKSEKKYIAVLFAGAAQLTDCRAFIYIFVVSLIIMFVKTDHNDNKKFRLYNMATISVAALILAFTFVNVDFEKNEADADAVDVVYSARLIESGMAENDVNKAIYAFKFNSYLKVTPQELVGDALTNIILLNKIPFESHIQLIALLFFGSLILYDYKDDLIDKMMFTAIRGILLVSIVLIFYKNGNPVGLAEDWIASDGSKKTFLSVSGHVIKALDLKDIYNDLGIYITDDKYVVSPTDYTSTDYETDQIKELKEYLDDRNIDLVYVNLPTKYTDDSMFFENFGRESYSNRNADKFIERISSAGIKTLDLRDNIIKDGMNVREMFFRTDHHWTPQSALWAAGHISGFLNENAGYDIDMSIYDPSRYDYKTWTDCWTGEQGSKMSSVYMGHDDFTSVTPNFRTSFEFRDTDQFNDFQGFFHEPDLEIYKDPDSPASWYYLYVMKSARNLSVDHGKVLLVCDSYSNTLGPFLALGVSEIDNIELRYMDQNLIEYIDGKDYDTVLICYAQFMIGAHDDPDSANYKMFDFMD